MSTMSTMPGGLAMVTEQEQSSADLVLLQQNLGKAKRVTARMATLLTGFDDRLARLEKSVVPIYRSTKDLSKLQRNIEAALLAIDAVVGTNDLVDREQSVIERPPKDDLTGYQASLTRLKRAMESMERSSNSDRGDLVAQNNKAVTVERVRSLIDLGCRKMGDLLLDSVRLASPRQGWPDVTSWDERTPFPTLMPQQIIENSVTILQFIQSILGTGSGYDRELQRSYGEIRGIFMAATLNYVGKESIDVVEVTTRAAALNSGRLPSVGKRGFGRFLDTMFVIAKSEHSLAGNVFGKSSASQVYRYIVPSLLTILTATGAAINATIKKSLSANAIAVRIALSCYAEMTAPNRVDVFEDWIRVKTSRKENELAQLSHAFKGSCMRSLPEFLEDTRAFGNRPLTLQEQTQASVSTNTINVVSFTKQLADQPEIVEMFLGQLGDSKWLPMGFTTKNGPLSIRDTDAGVLVLFPRYLADTVYVLLSALDARAMTLARQSLSSTHLRREGLHGNLPPNSRQSTGIAAIFTLNNTSYLRREIMMNSIIPDLLAGGSAPSRRDSVSTTATGAANSSDTNIEDELNRRHRAAKASYLDIFSPLVSCLMDAGVEHSKLKSAVGIGNTEKQDTKDRFARFNDALEDIESIHRVARIDRGEEALRERVKDEVVRMCVPTYMAFLKRHDNFSSKNPQKHLKIDAAGLQQRLESFFTSSKVL